MTHETAIPAQVVKTQQQQLYKKIISDPTCRSMDMQEESLFLVPSFLGAPGNKFIHFFGQKHFRRLTESALIYLPNWIMSCMSLQPRGV